jgi:hypothetical protein
MGQAMTLLDVIANLAHFDEVDTIYLEQPWNRGATAVVAREPDSGRVPDEAADLGLDYFLEVSIAREILEDWASSRQSSPSLEAKCDRIIQYAINDA